MQLDFKMVKLRGLAILVTCTLAGLVETGFEDGVYATNIDANENSSSKLKAFETMEETQLVEISAYGHNVDSFDSEFSSRKNQTHPLHAQEHNVTHAHVIEEIYLDADYELQYAKQHPKNMKRQNCDDPMPGPSFQIPGRGGKPLAI